VSTSLRRPALRGALLLLTAALVAGLATVAARPAAAADNPSSVFGADIRDYHVDRLVVENAPGRDQSYAKDAGLTWVRAGVGWAWAQPARQGEWDTAYMDKAKATVKKLTDRGFTPIVILQAAPDWVNGGAHKPCWVPDEHFGTFATYAADVVRDFKASGIPVTYWQIWNEPEASIENFGGNMDQGIGCFGTKGDAKTYGGERYARFMQQAYKAIKEADAEAKVISGGSELGCHDCPQSKFWRSVLATTPTATATRTAPSSSTSSTTTPTRAGVPGPSRTGASSRSSTPTPAARATSSTSSTTRASCSRSTAGPASR
jgi:hypothetical protein